MTTGKAQKTRKSGPVTATIWKSAVEKYHSLDLPSGVTVVIRRLNIFEIAESGHLDLAQSSVMLKKFMQIDGMLKGDPSKLTADDDSIPFEIMTEENMLAILKMFRQAATAAVVEPAVSFPPESGTLPPDVMNVMDIPFEDLQAIWLDSVEGGNRQPLNSFRGKK